MSALILCGLFCSGKTTLGEALAQKQGLPFYDTDRIMEKHYAKPIREVWRALGEQGFRDFETSTIKELRSEPCVIALGGGTLLRQQNRFHLSAIGQSIYLKISLEGALERLKKRGIPAYAQNWEKIVPFAKERLPIFETFCNHVFEVEGYSIEQCVIHLDRFFGSQLGENPTAKP